MGLRQGTRVTPEQQADLDEQIQRCDNPLLGLVLEGLKALGAATAAGCFTIGRFQAVSRGSRRHSAVIQKRHENHRHLQSCDAARLP